MEWTNMRPKKYPQNVASNIDRNSKLRKINLIWPFFGWGHFEVISLRIYKGENLVQIFPAFCTSLDFLGVQSPKNIPRERLRVLASGIKMARLIHIFHWFLNFSTLSTQSPIHVKNVTPDCYFCLFSVFLSWLSMALAI